jgi:ubiquinone/menaquinone biosynthesis C-methylase UbiE
MALKEIARVLRPSGTLIISIVHPFTDRGRFAEPEPDAPFVLLHGCLWLHAVRIPLFLG